MKNRIKNIVMVGVAVVLMGSIGYGGDVIDEFMGRALRMVYLESEEREPIKVLEELHISGGDMYGKKGCLYCRLSSQLINKHIEFIYKDEEMTIADKMNLLVKMRLIVDEIKRGESDDLNVLGEEEPIVTIHPKIARAYNTLVEYLEFCKEVKEKTEGMSEEEVKAFKKKLYEDEYAEFLEFEDENHRVVDELVHLVNNGFRVGGIEGKFEGFDEIMEYLERTAKEEL